jgi:hypothetical protein
MRAHHQSDTRGPRGKAHQTHQRAHSSVTDKQLIALIKTLGNEPTGKRQVFNATPHQVRQGLVLAGDT